MRPSSFDGAQDFADDLLMADELAYRTEVQRELRLLKESMAALQIAIRALHQDIDVIRKMRAE